MVKPRSQTLLVLNEFRGQMSQNPVLNQSQQVVLRYFMGYWPSKIPCALNVILMIGYATIDAIIGGQVLSAVSGGGLTVIVGIVVVSVVSWIVAVFGMALFQKYERYVAVNANFILSLMRLARAETPAHALQKTTS